MIQRCNPSHAKWRLIHITVALSWFGVGVIGVFTDWKTSLVLIFFASMWANTMMHLQKAQSYRMEIKQDDDQQP